MSTDKKAQHQLKKKKWNNENIRQNKRQLLILPPQATGSPAYKSRNTEAKATEKVERNFLKSPRKKRAVFKNLAVKLFSGGTPLIGVSYYVTLILHS